ncbi:MAG: hypothetical protein MZW92_47240 [Comamonadaceae bacterium]|nr:hypothetical protein [Comamonadaceae bacterium]
MSIFTKGLVAEEYAATKHSIYQNEETRSDFQRCYAFVETMEQFKPSYTNTSSFDRNISETGSAKTKVLIKVTVLQLSGPPFPRRRGSKILAARKSKKSGDKHKAEGRRIIGQQQRQAGSSRDGGG